MLEINLLLRYLIRADSPYWTLNEQPHSRQKSLTEGRRDFLPRPVFFFGVTLSKTNIAPACFVVKKIEKFSQEIWAVKLPMHNFILPVKFHWLIFSCGFRGGNKKNTVIRAGSLFLRLHRSRVWSPNVSLFAGYILVIIWVPSVVL